MIQHSTWQLLSRRPILDPSDNKLYHTSPLGNLDFMEARHKFVRHRFPIRKRVFLFKRRKNKASLRKQLPYFLRPSALLSKILITSPLRPSPSSKDIGKVGFTTLLRRSPEQIFISRRPRCTHGFDGPIAISGRAMRCSHRGRGLATCLSEILDYAAAAEEEEEGRFITSTWEDSRRGT